MKYCEECGAVMEDNAVYCDECGAKAEPLTDEQSETIQSEDIKPLKNNEIEPTKNIDIVKHKNTKLRIIMEVLIIVIGIIIWGSILLFGRKNNKNDTSVMNTGDSKTIDTVNETENTSTELVTLEATTEESATEEATTEEPTTEEPTTEEPIIDKTISNAYIGKWWDLYSQRCNMDITCEDGVNYSINIEWASGAAENIEWLFKGTYDSNKKGIVYVGKCVSKLYPDEGDIVTTDIYTNGEGLLYIGEEGLLYWDDYIENVGARCMFEKSNY